MLHRFRLGRCGVIRYQITWLVAIFFALASGVAITGLGCFLLRRVVEDFSNSVAWRAFLVRGVRIAPGAALSSWGAGY